MSTHSPADDFEAGKKVFELLKELSPERQERVMRWVSEGLGFQLATSSLHTTHKAAAPAATSADRGAGATGHTDIKSFVVAKAPKSDNQFAAVVAYYYRFEAPTAQRREAITADVLQEATRLAGRTRLGNPGATLFNAKNTGYLDSAGTGQFSINSVGENLVAMTLPGGGATGAAAPSRRKSGNKKKR